MRVRSMVPVALAAMALLPAVAFADGSDVFGDVANGSFYDTAVGNISDAGITGGCQTSPPLYCPDNPVTRGEMAVFLDRVLGNPEPVVDAAMLDGHTASDFVPAGRVDFGDTALADTYVVGGVVYSRGIDFGSIPDGATITRVTIRAMAAGGVAQSFGVFITRLPFAVGQDLIGQVEGASLTATYNPVVTEFVYDSTALLAAGLSTLLVDHDSSEWHFGVSGPNSASFDLRQLLVEYTLPA